MRNESNEIEALIEEIYEGLEDVMSEMEDDFSQDEHFEFACCCAIQKMFFKTHALSVYAPRIKKNEFISRFNSMLDFIRNDMGNKVKNGMANEIFDQLEERHAENNQ